ncbi:MAG: pirin family protein [Synechococcus sp. Tobar2m-G35]|nr:pirin family protein [Synechococcus sp. Tobar2m-G35]
MNSTILPGALHHRAADDRFHSRLDWLDSRHSFSFAGHDDPAWRGFGLHPHRDMEIVTVMVAGQLEHRDSMGHGAVLHSDEVQRMSAGTGLMHSEHNPGPDPCRLLQIWIEPLQQGLSPSYEQTRLPCGTGGGWTRLIDPQRREGSMAIARGVQIWRARPAAGHGLDLPQARPGLAWLQVIDGRFELTLSPLPGGDRAPLTVALGPGDGLGFTASPGRLQATSDDVDLLLFDLG